MKVHNCDHCQKTIETHGIIRICAKCAGELAKRAAESREAQAREYSKNNTGLITS